MKISLIGPVYPYRGGIAHYTTSLYVALTKAGHKVNILSFKRQYPAFLYPGQSDKDPSTNPVRVEAEYSLDPLHPWTWHQSAQKILVDQPDLVLIQWWTTFWGFAYAALIHFLQKKIRVIYLIHNVLPHENRIWDRMLARFALGKASAFIVQSPNQRERLLGLLPDANIHYCSHPVYQRFSEQNISKEMARQQLGLPLNTPVLLFFGIVRPYKGLKHLVDAVSKTVSSVKLVVAGEFWEDSSLYQKQIAHLGLTERVTLINRYISNEDAHILFSAADALVAPYVGGTQSGAVELALGYGLPVVITDSISEGVQDQFPSVHVVPSGDANALTKAIDSLVANSTNRSSLHAIRDDWNRMVDTIEKI